MSDARNSNTFLSKKIVFFLQITRMFIKFAKANFK